LDWDWGVDEMKNDFGCQLENTLNVGRRDCEKQALRSKNQEPKQQVLNGGFSL
jgi:hypothetical protein